MKLVMLGALVAAVWVAQPDQRALLLNPDAPEFRSAAPPLSIVRFETTRGAFELEVTRTWAPRGADRFVALARHGYYNGNRFFRIRRPVWVQFGINGDPTVAQAWRERTIPDDPFVQSNARGTVAFAFAVANGRATQVFINTANNAATHDKEPFTPFGRVIVGMEVIDALNSEHGEGPGGIRAGKQDAFFKGGNAWLDAQFPRLDYVKSTIVR